ncbi:hypothetical protein NDU88_002830 [Pleurodeles waltl]|uniref:DDE Tnp4 domain-containing protein n=1 Tax=Pleurodeles waltl TaxID=8319 RepID=A0AAV7REK3_PLEWA|nr:hypothetical protein NDU88_002830 [Pleurodeles waltl]
MQGRRSRPKKDVNGRALYLCFRAQIPHGQEAESENDAQPDLRKKLTPGVVDAIIGLKPRHICFPNTQQKQQETKQGFYLINGFPHVLGAIDCTHVCLVPPVATEDLYRNRKHTHSMNVQAIVDHQVLITNIVAKYPGSVIDSFNFRYSTINQHFQDGRYCNELLVADQGYGIQPWIMTPFGNPSTAAERAYNEEYQNHGLSLVWVSCMHEGQSVTVYQGRMQGLGVVPPAEPATSDNVHEISTHVRTLTVHTLNQIAHNILMACVC